MYVIGLTGGIGSGKSAATERFASHGITVVDADIASRTIVEPGRPALAAIREHFGPEVIQADGQLDRRALRQIVFSAPDERRWLEALTHPLIGQELIDSIARSQSAYTLLVSPLLLESGQVRLARRIVVVDVPVNTQIIRTMARDNTTEDAARAIIAAQMSRQDRLARADDVIDNDGDLAHLHSQVDALHERYMMLAKDQ
jgi:dephospho-CoA kinase